MKGFIIIYFIFSFLQSFFIKTFLKNSIPILFSKGSLLLKSLVFLLIVFSVNIHSDSHPKNKVSAVDALKKLKDGNERFLQGKSNRPSQDLKRIKEVASQHEPFAVILGCSDSRVPIEIIFDHGLGDLFILRNAGQVTGHASWGSIEYAVELLGVNLIVVLGHSKCGAVTAACNVPEVPGHIVSLINAIKPAVEASSHMKGDRIDNAVRANVMIEVSNLKKLEPVLSKRVLSGKVKIIGAVYDVLTGKVEFLPDIDVKKCGLESVAKN